MFDYSIVGGMQMGPDKSLPPVVESSLHPCIQYIYIIDVYNTIIKPLYLVENGPSF